jgi:signal transduction histidine kinase
MTRLRRRLMLPFALFTLGVSALFGLFAMAFVYTVEDRFLDRVLAQEAQRQQAHRAAQGDWSPVTAPGVALYRDAAALPDDLARVLAVEPLRREVPGDAGRHYHLRALDTDGQPPWLVAEVSTQLVVRPMRDGLLRWLAGWGVLMAILALALAWWLARRISKPLEQLAAEVSSGTPERLPQALPQSARDDEIGEVARRFESLLARTGAFIAREQAFTRDVSHELRTPLAVLGMAIERLQADPTLDPERRQQLEAMRAATTQMAQAVDTLLLLAREAGAPRGPQEPVAVLPLVESWVLAHASWIDQRALSLEVALSRTDALALPAPVLQRALAILLENAFLHGSAGGSVRVCFADGALQVDNPVAAPPATAHDGLGLGLDILRRLLERHGAVLDLQHAEGRMRATVQA